MQYKLMRVNFLKLIYFPSVDLIIIKTLFQAIHHTIGG